MFKNIFKSNNTPSKKMNWEKLDKIESLEDIKEVSKNQKVLIFKHSTRCPISANALNRLERSWNEEEMQNKNIKPYYLDLITYRNISDKIAQEFKVMHQSPQVIVVENGEAIYDNSHYGIKYEELLNL